MRKSERVPPAPLHGTVQDGNDRKGTQQGEETHLHPPDDPSRDSPNYLPSTPPDNHSPSTLSQVPMGPGGDAFPGPGWTELEGRSNRRLLPPIQRRVNANQVQISYPPNIFLTFYQFVGLSLPLPSSKYWGNEEEAKI